MNLVKQHKVKKHLLSAQGDVILTDAGAVEKKRGVQGRDEKFGKRVFAKALSLLTGQFDHQKSTKETNPSDGT